MLLSRKILFCFLFMGIWDTRESDLTIEKNCLWAQARYRTGIVTRISLRATGEKNLSPYLGEDRTELPF